MRKSRGILLCWLIMGLWFTASFSTDVFAQKVIKALPKAQIHRENRNRAPFTDDTTKVETKETKKEKTRKTKEAPVPEVVNSETESKSPKRVREKNNVINENVDSLVNVLAKETTVQVIDTATMKAQWMPDPKKALWYAIIFPGGGQIYNRKYWKLPLIYGGFLGCVYALRWNNGMYSDYSRAYIDLMDDNPNTKSYENFLPIGYDVQGRREQLEKIFKNKKDYYRRYRDLSFFCMLGVYGLSILDAYIDAEMMNFSISKDLSMKVRPAVIGERNVYARRALQVPDSYGVSLGFSF